MGKITYTNKFTQGGTLTQEAAISQEVTMQLIKGHMLSAAIAAAAVAFLVVPSNAAVIYLDSIDNIPAPPAPAYPPFTTGLQQFQGNLGMEFQVNSPIIVDALGAFDNGVQSGLSGTTGTGVEVGIFNALTGQLVGTSATFNGSTKYRQIGGDAFQSVSPFLLGKGFYAIVALDDPNYNQGYFPSVPYNQYQTLNSLGGALTFINYNRFDFSATLELPTIQDGGPVDRYDAGTFAAVVTPLPPTWTMLIAGFVGLGFFANRGSRKNAAALAA
jgi:hypothetical protein